MPETEPQAKVFTVAYLEIVYGDQKIVMPASEGPDVIRQVAKLLPDDAGEKK